MNRIPAPLRKELPPTLLYIDDIKLLCSQLAEVGSDICVSIITRAGEEYQLDLNELKGFPTSSIKQLNIKSGDPYINIEFSLRGSSIYVASSHKVSFDVISSILHTIERHKRVIVSLFGHWWMLPLLYLFIYAGELVPSNLLKSHFGQFFSIAIFAIFVFCLYSFLQVSFRHSLIIPYASFEKKDFFRRNMDALIVALVGTILGGVLLQLMLRAIN